MPPSETEKWSRKLMSWPGEPLNKISSRFPFAKTVLDVLTSFLFEKRRIDGTLIATSSVAVVHVYERTA